MKLNLTIKERLLFSMVLPKQGSMIELHNASLLNQLVSLSEDEVKEVDLRQDEGMTLFNDNGKTLDLELTKEQVDLLKTVVRIKDENKEVTADIYSLFLKINELT